MQSEGFQQDMNETVLISYDWSKHLQQDAFVLILITYLINSSDEIDIMGRLGIFLMNCF